MERYAPIHPERPLRRLAVALAISLAAHAALGALLYALAVAAAAALLLAQAAQPKAVTLSDLDAARWEENRRIEGEPRQVPTAKPIERGARPIEQAPPAPPEHSAVAMIAPSTGEGGRQPAAKAGGPAATPRGGETTAPAPAGPSLAGEGMGPAPDGTLDLSPRPQTIRPLSMRFDPVGPGQLPVDEGTSFGGLTVQTPEAWRFTNFFGRAVEAMNSVYRYELGAPVPLELQTLIVTHRAREKCSFTSVQIDRTGRVVDASVRRTSGIAELDQLIIEVIRKTAPFVNVPEGLTDPRGVYADTWGLCIGIR